MFLGHGHLKWLQNKPFLPFFSFPFFFSLLLDESCSFCINSFLHQERIHAEVLTRFEDPDFHPLPPFFHSIKRLPIRKGSFSIQCNNLCGSEAFPRPLSWTSYPFGGNKGFKTHLNGRGTFCCC